MKNLLFFILSCISQIAFGQMESKPIAEFASYDPVKEILIDVRTPEEFNAGHIDGALNIDWFSEDFNKQVEKLEKDKTIYVYCKKGGRSLKSQARLKELGFLNVVNLDGGFDAYSKK